MFVANELQSSVSVFAWDANTGQLTLRQTVPTLPADQRAVTSYASELQVHPSGRFLYAANRGDDSISVFQWERGELTWLVCEPVRVQWPRHFDLDPTGRWLLAAGERSNSISVFRVDPETGRLEHTGQTISCPQPMCIVFSADGSF